MNFIQKILLCSMALLSSSHLFAATVDPDASVIELNNQDIIECQAQLFNVASKDAYPVILLYASNDPFSDLFMPTYVKVAKSLHGQRDFYRYDAGTANPYITDECLGLNGAIVAPTVMVVLRLEDDEMLSNPMRAIGGTKWSEVEQQAVTITEDELKSAITLPFPTRQKLYSTQVVVARRVRH